MRLKGPLVARRAILRWKGAGSSGEMSTGLELCSFWRWWLPLMLLINTANSLDHNESGCFVVYGPAKIFESMALIPCVPLYFPSSPRVE